MPSKALMRLDTVSWRTTVSVGVLCAAWVLANLIIGLTGMYYRIHAAKGTLKHFSLEKPAYTSTILKSRRLDLNSFLDVPFSY